MNIGRGVRNLCAWAGIVVLGALPSVAQRTQQLYDGAAHIGNLNHVVVVYPVGEEGLEAINRDSAALRASYLTSHYGVVTEIASDAEVTEQQLQEHLLVLGWDNALLKEHRAGVWERQGPGRHSLGITDIIPSDDLLFMALSPFNEKKYLTFWSRIDPERDRFFSFPFVGSDWAIYRDFFVVHQGMFKDPWGWPPERNLYAEHTEPHRVFAKQGETEHYELYYDPAVVDVEAAGRIGEARETALGQAAEALGIAIPENFRVQLSIYKDAATKTELTGIPDAVHSLAVLGQLGMPMRHAGSPNPHEEFHLLAGRLYGTCFLTAMYEGLATTAENHRQPEQFDAWAALLVQRDEILSLDTVFDNEKIKAVAGDLTFPTSALVVRWIRETTEPADFGRLYTMRRDEAEAELRRAMSLPAERSLDEAFGHWLDERAQMGQTELAIRTALAAAQSRISVGDFVGAAEEFTKALELRPGDAMTRYRLAQAHFEVGAYDESRAAVEALLKLERPTDPTWLPIYGEYLLARIHDYSGNRVAARSGYNKVLTMPDEHGAHRRAREALELLGDE